jgi:hypothetical protein
VSERCSKDKTVNCVAESSRNTEGEVGNCIAEFERCSRSTELEVGSVEAEFKRTKELRSGIELLNAVGIRR